MTPTFFFLQWIERRLVACYKRIEWMYQIAKAEKWKSECQSRYDRLDEDVQHIIDLKEIDRRRHAVRKHQKGVRVHDEQKHGGPVGYRVCSSSQWDNAIRASEEDR